MRLGQIRAMATFCDQGSYTTGEAAAGAVEGIDFIRVAVDQRGNVGFQHLDRLSVAQYESEERSLIALRIKVERNRLGQLLEAMCAEPLAPPDKILQLRAEMAEFHQNADFHFYTMIAFLQETLLGK